MNVVSITRRRVVRRRELETAIGYSRSSINTFISEGMPTAGKDRRGRNLFNVGEVTAWLATRNIDPGLATTRERGIA